MEAEKGQVFSFIPLPQSQFPCGNTSMYFDFLIQQLSFL